MKISRIYTSWDLWLSIATSILMIFLLPEKINIDFAKDTYFAGLTVLSVIFGIFFASLAIIMSSSHDDFVSFLEETKEYTSIISTFRYTLASLFIALVISIVLYIYSSFLFSNNVTTQSKWLFILFCFFTAYSLFAVFMSTGDAINYSKYRSKFLEKFKGNDKK